MSAPLHCSWQLRRGSGESVTSDGGLLSLPACQQQQLQILKMLLAKCADVQNPEKGRLAQQGITSARAVHWQLWQLFRQRYLRIG